MNFPYARYRPEAILFGILVRGMDSCAVLKNFLADPIMWRVPVMALSADAMTVDIERGPQSGFSEYLTQPVRM